MAIVLQAGDLLNVQHVFTNTKSATAINVLHYRVGSFTGVVPAMPDFLAAVANQLGQAFVDQWKQSASNEVKFVNTRATNVFPLPRSVGVNWVPAQIPGQLTSEALPLQDTVTILKRTNVGSRWGLGRIYITGLAEEQQDSGVLTAAAKLAMQNLADQLQATPTITAPTWSAVLNPCLVRGREDNPVSITNIIRWELSNDILKTQRRRRPGKGI